jgi:hypothetical protein
MNLSGNKKLIVGLIAGLVIYHIYTRTRAQG